MIWRRTLLVVVLTVTGLALQTAVFGPMTLLGAKPEVLMLVTVAIAMNDGPVVGSASGFAMGLASDVLLQLPQGVSAFTFTLVGYAVGTVRPMFQTPSAWLPMGMVSVSTAVGVLFYGGFAFMLGEESLSATRIISRALLAALYNALLTPFIFPVVRRLAARMRPPSAAVMR